MKNRIVFIDGYCVLCNGFAKYVLKNDKNKKMYVSSLQGDTAKELLSLEDLHGMDSILYLRDRMVYSESTAVLYLLVDMGGWRKLMKVFLLIPKSLRDWVYKGVAKRRYKWFGKNDSCELPDENTEGRILS